MRIALALALLFHTGWTSHWAWAQRGWSDRPPSNRFVNSLDDFRRHTELHIRRVEALGMALYHTFPEDFAGVEEEVFREFLKLHDKAKVTEDLELLRAHGMVEPKPFLPDMYQYYGKNVHWDEAAKKFFGNLNDIDDAILEGFLIRHGLPYEQGDSVGRLLVRAAKMADIIDRINDPVAMEEMFRISEPLHSKEFTKEAKWEKFLGQNYKNITAGLNYASAKKTKRVSACILRELGT